MSTGEGNKKLGWVVALLAVAVLVLGGLLYLRSEEKQAVELEKQSLTIELADMKADLLSQMGANDSLNAFIQYETQRLSGLIDSINTVNVENKKQLTAYRGRLAGMKKQNAALVAQLDSTNAAYAALKLREQMIADSLNAAVDANAALSGQNTGLRQTVEKGKQLVIATSTVQAVRIAKKWKRAQNTPREAYRPAKCMCDFG
jgi:transcriptional regulator of heat shock response